MKNLPPDGAVAPTGCSFRGWFVVLLRQLSCLLAEVVRRLGLAVDLGGQRGAGLETGPARTEDQVDGTRGGRGRGDRSRTGHEGGERGGRGEAAGSVLDDRSGRRGLGVAELEDVVALGP